MTESYEYWLTYAQYDLDSAKAIMSVGRLSYVGYTCQQAIEKALKAVIAKNGTFPPREHNLRRLADNANLTTEMSEEQIVLLAELTPLNIQVRYPGDWMDMISGLTEDYYSGLITRTEALFQWIKEYIETQETSQEESQENPHENPQENSPE